MKKFAHPRQTIYRSFTFETFILRINNLIITRINNSVKSIQPKKVIYLTPCEISSPLLFLVTIWKAL
ncbi:hypothetical protein EhVM1_000162 [Emiliania huxleyi virus M1]|nr:hypothetical protein EhVM1_000162 [Emiliania huxleyi virus M1]